jgi:hypothetical protein
MPNNIAIENARILFRNFGGRESRFNLAGRRNFCVVIPDDDMAERLSEDGWNVKRLRPKDEGDEATPYLQVAVAFNSYPPKIVLISGGNKTYLDESTVDMLDWADIQNVDLVVRPYQWEVNGTGGIKAYVKSMYVTIDQDVFAEKYDA